MTERTIDQIAAGHLPALAAESTNLHTVAGAILALDARLAAVEPSVTGRQMTHPAGTGHRHTRLGDTPENGMITMPIVPPKIILSREAAEQLPDGSAVMADGCFLVKDDGTWHGAGTTMKFRLTHEEFLLLWHPSWGQS